MRILITSVGTATSVNLIKEFKKKGDYVVGVDINPYGYTAGSCLSDTFYQIVLATDDRYLSKLSEIIVNEKIDVLIPVHDIEIYSISQNIDKISCKCMIPDVETIEMVRDKYICNLKMREIGIQVPEILFSSTDDKLILRDRFGVGSKGIEIILKGKQIPAYNTNEKFLQRFVEGEEYTVDILADQNGKPVYIIPRKRLEVKSGVATKVSIEKDCLLINYVEQILNHVNLPGFSNIQFIKDAKENYWFVEINCRFSGCGAATIAVCENYIDDYKKIVDKRVDFRKINENVRWNTIVTRYYEECVYENNIS